MTPSDQEIQELKAWAELALSKGETHVTAPAQVIRYLAEVFEDVPVLEARIDELEDELEQAGEELSKCN